MIKKNFLFVLFCLFSLVVNAQVIADGVYVIKSSVNPNYVIDLSGSNVFNGNNIQLWERNNTNAQKWIVENVNGAVIIKSSINKSFVIDLNRSNAASGTNIQLWESNGTKAQRWYVMQKGNYFEFHSAVNSSYVIDLNSSNIASGENIQCWESNNTNAQRWILERIEGGGTNTGGGTVIIDNSPMPCAGCGDTKKCSICNGKGYTVSASSRRMYSECGACNGTGICQVCRYR